MHCCSYTQFLPRPARKESNLSELNGSYELTVLLYILCQEDSLVYVLNGLSSKQDSFFIDAKSLLSTVKELTNPICHLLHAYYCGSPTLPLVHYKLFHSVRNKTFQCKSGILLSKKRPRDTRSLGSPTFWMHNFELVPKTLEVRRFSRIYTDVLLKIRVSRKLRGSWADCLGFFYHPHDEWFLPYTFF